MSKLKFSGSLLVAGAMLLAILVAMPYQAEALEDKVVIVTSYPKDLTGPFKKAFEAKYPGTMVEVLQKKTSAGVKYIQETAQGNTSDLMWASAPDAFEVLKGDGLLTRYAPKASGIPKNIGSYPINDPDGYYIGFAGSGYGIMWNTRYLKAKKIPVPKEWADLKKPVYHNHVGMSAPSRSGTTHLTVETVLQGEGWDKGWASWKEMAGNFKMVTERSFGVPEGVNSGDFGVGVVIDFFGFSSKATGFPVDFVYPTVTTLVPANIAIVKDAPHPQAAAAFIEYLLSIEGQELLLDPAIRRLPVNPATYAKAPKDFPNPFEDATEFHYRLNNEAERARLSIFTLRGQRIRSMDVPTRINDNVVLWDGRDEDGDPVSNGLYFYKLQVWGRDGKSTSRIERIVRAR